MRDIVIRSGEHNCNNGNYTMSFKFNKYNVDSCIGMIFRYQDLDNYNEIDFCFNNTITYKTNTLGKYEIHKQV